MGMTLHEAIKVTGCAHMEDREWFAAKKKSPSKGGSVYLYSKRDGTMHGCDWTGIPSMLCKEWLPYHPQDCNCNHLTCHNTHTCKTCEINRVVREGDICAACIMCGPPTDPRKTIRKESYRDAADALRYSFFGWPIFSQFSFTTAVESEEKRLKRKVKMLQQSLKGEVELRIKVERDLACESEQKRRWVNSLGHANERVESLCDERDRLNEDLHKHKNWLKRAGAQETRGKNLIRALTYERDTLRKANTTMREDIGRLAKELDHYHRFTAPARLRTIPASAWECLEPKAKSAIFHIVWSPEGTFPPTKKHWHESKANKEATRLAEKNPGKNYYVLRALRMYKTAGPALIRLEELK